MTHLLRFLSLAIVLGLLAVGQSRAQVGLSASGQILSPTAPAPVRVDSVYVNPEVRPQFVGGKQAFAAYLSKNIRYPQQAMTRHVSGRVLVAFTLSATGKVQDAYLVSGPGYGLNEEALRLVWLMPNWEPGRANGQPVRVACTVPISFDTEQ